MKGIRTTLSALLTLMLLLAPASWNTQAEESGNAEPDIGTYQIYPKNASGDKYRPGQLLVKYKPAASKRTAPAELNLRSMKTFAGGLELMTVAASQDLDKLKRVLEESDEIEYVEYDYLVYPSTRILPNDPYLPQQWGLLNYGQSINGIRGIPGVDSNVLPSWTFSTGRNMVVAVIDTGINSQHPELVNQMWINCSEIPGNEIDDDNNGFIDDVCGYDFYHNDSTVYDPEDFDVHGTYVAGIIAAQGNNNEGVVGVAPGVKILPVKFIGPEGGALSDAIAAIEYAHQMGADICNLSWEGSEYSQALEDTIDEYPDILFVAAAGNTGVNIDETPAYPAALPCVNLISVGALDNRGTMPPWSNYGTTSVDLVAPGLDIIGVVDLPDPQPDDYLYGAGTSASAPYVSGIAALVMSCYPSLNAVDVKSIIIDSAKPWPGIGGLTASGGTADSFGAMIRAAIINHH